MNDEVLVDFINKNFDPGMLLSAAIFSLVFAFICFMLARKRERHPVLWGLMGLLFNLVAVVALLILGRSDQAALREDEKWKLRKRKFENGEVAVEEISQDDEKEDIVEIEKPAEHDLFWYFLDEEHQRFGPVSFWELQGKWKNGVNDTTYVWNETMKDWKRIKSLPALLSLMQESEA